MSTPAVFVSEIVKVLINDTVLVSNRTQFIDLLGTPPADKEQWEGLYTMGIITGYKYFTKLFEELVQRTTPVLGKLRIILESCGCKAAADSLESIGNDEGIIKISQQAQLQADTISLRTVISFGVMQPTTFFVGRDAEVRQLTKLFLNQCPPKTVVISGMGGQGKTELCRQFIKTLKNQDSPPSLIWLLGDSVNSLSTFIIQLANLSKIPTTIDGKQVPFVDLVIQVSISLSASSLNGSWLVVIDNVDESYPEFLKTVAVLLRHGAFVLITTRKNDIFSGEAKQLKLGVLEDDDALELVIKALNQPQVEEIAKLLCHEMGNHALALRQAIAYINAQQNDTRDSYGIQDYLRDFRNNKTRLQNPVFIDGYDHTMHIIVTLTIKTIEDKHARIGRCAVELLDILCMIRPEGVSVECLQTLVQSTQVDQAQHRNLTDDLQEALLLLKTYCLISYEDATWLSIHRLLQKVAKSPNSNCIRLIIFGIHTASASVDELKQVLSIWQHADAQLIRDIPHFANDVFHRMICLSLVLEMLSFTKYNHKVLSEILGSDHPQTLFMEHNVARAFLDNGNYGAALDKLVEIVDKFKKIFGNKHEHTLTVLSNMVAVLGAPPSTQDYDTQLHWQTIVLKITSEELGDKHKHTMLSRHNMAVILGKLGKIDEALPYHKEVLEWQCETLGPSHKDTLSSRHNMAAVLYKKNLFKEAKEDFEVVLKLRIEVLGEQHIHTLETKDYLAITLWELGQREETIKLMEEVLETRVKLLGPNHPETAATRTRIIQRKSALSLIETLIQSGRFNDEVVIHFA